MVALNPDFRSADVVTPPDLNRMTGWAPRGTTEAEAIDFERRFAARIAEEEPELFQAFADPEPDARILKSWNDFQESKGRYPGSFDWSLLDEFCLKKPLLWLPQIIGSCVCSNTFRAYVLRMMYQTFILGQAQELFGKDEFGVNNFAFYCPFTYGLARRKANMRGGDGLYCSPMQWSLAQGVVKCDTPKLLQITRANGVADDRDFPEPQGNDGKAFYRAMGDWKYLDDLTPYMDFAVKDSVDVTSGDQLWELLKKGKPCYVCSMEAIRKVGIHNDGFTIHERDPGDSWAHNMAFHGGFISSDGERWIRESNESWGYLHIYNRRLTEVDKSFRQNRLTVASIGHINSPSSSPPSVLAA